MTLTFRICPPSGYLLRISFKNSTSGGVVCPNLPVKAKLSKPHGCKNWLFCRDVVVFNPTSPFKASSLQCDRYFLASGRHQGPDLHTVIQLGRQDVDTTHNLRY